jgi:Fe-S-cluster-containing hydrogenase component 2
MVEILRRTSRGEAEESDIERIRGLGASLQYSNCLHGPLSPVIILNTLEHFRDEWDEHALRFRCPAQVCEGLIRYRIVNQTAAVAEAAPICPTAAIAQDGGQWRIDDAKCIRCDACREIAPADIVVEDKYGDTIPLRTVVPADVARAGGVTPLRASIT